jgi:poly(U)-specific endoribonuclease
MIDIYQRIWESDKNGCSVSPRQGVDSWENPQADILLDVQVQADGKRNIDLATRPLFHKVNEEKFDLPTYASFIKLLNNYVANYRTTEIVDEEEKREIDNFIDTILPTEPIKIAREYVNEELGENLSEQQFRTRLQRIWFELFTNYYKGKSTHFCSGFEHVFVGEAKFDANFRITRDRTPTLGEISGYHSWIKFYKDEKVRDVNFLGYKFDLQGNQGPDNPNVVTLQMLWNLTDMNGKVIAQLFKKKGGFFVGPSPECEIAMGTVAYYESIHNKFKKDDRRLTTINGANYNIVLYRSITQEGSRGEFIRSFYPEFLGSDGKQEPEIDDTVVVPVDEIKNDGAVVIVAALPNPQGVDGARDEWVELKNVTNESIDLTGWEMRDKSARPEPLRGTLAPNEIKRFFVSRSSPNSMQLTNKAGFISVFNQQSDLVAAVNYSRANDGEILRFD